MAFHFRPFILIPNDDARLFAVTTTLMSSSLFFAADMRNDGRSPPSPLQPATPFPLESWRLAWPLPRGHTWSE